MGKLIEIDFKKRRRILSQNEQHTPWNRPRPVYPFNLPVACDAAGHPLPSDFTKACMKKKAVQTTPQP